MEYEIRRRVKDITAAEHVIQHLQHQIDGVAYTGRPVERLQRELDWWTAELARLEERLRVLLDDEAATSHD